MDIFSKCHEINDLLLKGNNEARNELIKLLDYHKKNDLKYSPMINSLIRETGLYPYLDCDTSNWQERFIYNAFRVNVGKQKATLHREQSLLLRKLVEEKNIAVSAPTSFGKSFVIDAYIQLKQPKNIVLIVPTIALTDETRRRLYKKFSDKYKIITTTDVELANYNILIFPQERAIHYVNQLKKIDLLVVDEFYKASSLFDSLDRSSTLMKAIIKLGKISKQKYYLAPNISKISVNSFTKNMVFEELLNCNTVFLEKHNLYKTIKKDVNKKSETLIKILKENQGTKTLIYAGAYSQINNVCNLIQTHFVPQKTKLLRNFQRWLSINYDPNWQLTSNVIRGTGIHNGQLHRALSQIQIKLFEEPEGLNNIVSTSSIIEGVNTSAENVIIWRNKNGRNNLNDFTYKNIIGRGGRMFRHFVGKIYILEKPPEQESTQLDLPFPDELIGEIVENDYDEYLNNEQISKAVTLKQNMELLLGKENYIKLQKSNVIQSSNSELTLKIATDLKNNGSDWNGLSYLNSKDVNSWDRLLYKFIGLNPGGWDIEYRKFVRFVKILTKNWIYTIPEMLNELDEINVGINDFFKLERNVTFKLSSLVNDVNELQKIIINNGVDISSFHFKISHAFMPALVYQLEEYGLPRMLSKKLEKNSIYDFNKEDNKIHSFINYFLKLGKQKCISFPFWDDFEKYIISYFFDGITLLEERDT
ncbi:MAG: DEAD/DEAH box helicase [Desulfitobacteriaceae bacterium]